MSIGNRKEMLAVIQASTLRELVEQVNNYNAGNTVKILKEDIVDIKKFDDAFSLIYFR